MKAEPASRILVEDPALADRVSNARLNPAYATTNSVERANIQEQNKIVQESTLAA